MDEIKRKLTLIEAQMGRPSLYARRIAARGLLSPAVGLIAGIVVQEAFPADLDIRLRLWMAALVVCVAAVLFYAAGARGRARPEIIAPGLLICFLCLGAIRLVAFQSPAPNGIERLVGDQRILATLRGEIITRPHDEAQDWCFADFAFTDPASSFYLKVHQVKTNAGWVRSTGTIRVHVDEPTPNLKLGDLVHLYCWLHRFDGPTNPGQFDVAAYLGRRNIHIGASVRSRDAIEVHLGVRPSLLSRLRARLAEVASGALLDGIPSEAQSQGLLQALLLGDRRDIDPRTYEAFRRTGLLHLISLSGMHLGIFIGVIWWLCKLAGLLKPARAAVCLVATAVFLMVVPPRAPTVRAAIIAWTFCLAMLLRRHPDPLNTLSLAAIISLLIRPTQVFEAGWQLSFAAVLGILLLQSRIEAFIHNHTGGQLRPAEYRASPWARLVGAVGSRIVSLFSTGLAAWTGGAGVLLYHFYTITPLACLWTVLLFLPVTVILTAGFFKIVLFFFLPTASRLLGEFITFIAEMLIRVVKVMAEPELNTILIGHVSVWIVAFCYVAVLLVLYIPIRRPTVKKALWLTLALVLIGYLGGLKWRRTHRSGLSLTCLDVGHGQAVVARLPGTRTIVFDAGSLHRSNVGGRIVVPFLDYVGIERLHAIVVSHNDIDHINGIPEIAYRRRVDHIYASDTFFGPEAEVGTAKRLIESLAQDGYRIEPMPETIPAGKTAIETLWPADHPEATESLTDNDRSLVCLIASDRAEALICSDIEQYAQRHIMALFPDLRADIVVVPHHGSTVTLDEEFLPSLCPGVLLCSCDARRAGVLDQIAPKCHAKRFDTAKNGAITICVGARADGMLSVAQHAWKQQQLEGD